MKDEPQKLLNANNLKIQILETGSRPEKYMKNKAVTAANPRSYSKERSNSPSAYSRTLIPGVVSRGGRTAVRPYGVAAMRVAGGSGLRWWDL